MKRAALRAFSLTLWLAAACTPPVPETPPTGVPADGGKLTIASSVPVAESGGLVEAQVPTEALPPAPAPGELIVRVRWQDPARSIATSAAYASVPQELVDRYLNAPREIALELVSSQVDAALFAPLVDRAAPIDFVIAADTTPSMLPTPFIGLSIGLTSLERAIATSNGKAEEIASGVWKLGGPDSFGSSCAVMRSNGRTPARLVCGDRTRDLTKLAPYMARTLATETVTGGDIHAEVSLRPLFDKYGSKWAVQAQGLPVLANAILLGIPKFDQAVKDAAAVLANEAGFLMKDLDGLSFDAAIEPSGGMKVKTEFRLRGKTSWLAQTMVDGASLAGPAPAMFWHLPASSASASYGFGVDPTRWEPLVATGRALIEGALEKGKIAGDGDRKALAGLLRLGKSKHVATVGASGTFPDAAPGASAFAAMLGQSVGWHLLGMEDGPGEIKKFLKDAVLAYNRPGLKSWLTRELGSEARFLPTVKAITAPRELGAGAMAVEIAVSNIPDPMGALTGGGGTVSVQLYVFAMVDGKRTYVGLALDKDRLAKLMQSLKGATPGPESLAQLTTLGGFRTERHTSATFFTLQGIVGSMKSSLSSALTGVPGGMGGIGRVLLGQLTLMPNRGTTPIVLFGDVADGPAPRATLTFHAPSPALADLGFMVEQVLSLVMAGQP